jgi:uncharacterized protein (DUF983 family)
VPALRTRPPVQRVPQACASLRRVRPRLRADPADGPAFFVMMTAAVPATAFGIWLELTYSPPLWVHAVTTLPIVLIACTLPLQFFKGWLVAEQYIRKAEEGRIARPDAPRRDQT